MKIISAYTARKIPNTNLILKQWRKGLKRKRKDSMKRVENKMMMRMPPDKKDPLNKV